MAPPEPIEMKTRITSDNPEDFSYAEYLIRSFITNKKLRCRFARHVHSNGFSVKYDRDKEMLSDERYFLKSNQLPQELRHNRCGLSIAE